MLGYNITVYRQTNDGASPATADSAQGLRLAVWETGIGGLDWIVALAKMDKAIFLGGNGYPALWTATVEELMPEISTVGKGAQNRWLLGESDIVTDKWEGKDTVAQDALAKCRLGEWLIVEGWDLS